MVNWQYNKQQLAVPQSPTLKALTKAQLIEYVLKLEDIVTAYREGYYAEGLKWFGVGMYGWGSFEDDVFYVEAHTPKEACAAFWKEIQGGDWQGTGSEYCVHGFDPTFTTEPPLMLAYVINEIGVYEQAQQEPAVIEWEKQ